MEPVFPVSQEVRGALRFQSYAPQPEVEGVFLRPLKVFRSLEGSFMELLRLRGGEAEGLPLPFEPRQLSVSRAEPGRMNAFHLHPRRHQHELWCALEGTMQVWLVDVREDSPTRGHRRQVVLSGEEPALLHIPSGVAHGFRAGSRGVSFLFASSDSFRLDDPNEGRLPWDFFGADLWAEDRG